jgi:hypothetical protein
MNTKILAFYLPQFHPIPENSLWWGPGFSEWHNVAKARPLFRGHRQPLLPGELGFYDLRLLDTHLEQAKLAKAHGIEGFCYWHYWFAGRRILERPTELILQSPQFKLPFCLAWANESWTGVWHGAPGKTLIEQNYPNGDADNHYLCLRRFFIDQRYIKIEGRPILYIYKPNNISECYGYLGRLRELAKKDGFPDLYIIGNWTPNPGGRFENNERLNLDGRAVVNITGRDSNSRARHVLSAICDKFFGALGSFSGPKVIEYSDAVREMLPRRFEVGEKVFPTVLPNWDNSPRSGRRGLVFRNSTPDKFACILRKAIDMVNSSPSLLESEKIVFIKSWNEWAEGNILEPDYTGGRQYLEAVKVEVEKSLDKHIHG